MCVPCVDLGGAADARDAHRCRTLGRRAVAELTVVVRSPALHRATHEESAGMVEPRGDRGGAAHARDGYRCRAVGRRTVAQLAATVCSPALDRATGEEGAGVV